MTKLTTAFSLNSLAASFSVALCLAVSPVLASGGHSSDTESTATAPSTDAPKAAEAPDDLTTCPKGQLWDVKHKKCVRLRGELRPDDQLADYAYALAKSNRYDEALNVLDMMKDGNTAEALNYRGYATRKLGRVDEGIGYYIRSVALDPHYTKVREYLGEAYVIKGQMDLAQEQLGQIKTLCGTACEPYRDLSQAIERARPL